MFKNMKIGTRLALGFGLVLVFLVVVSLLGINRLSTLNESIKEMAEDRYPKTEWANNIIDGLNINARASRNALLRTNEQDIAKELDRIKEARAIIVENMKHLEDTVRSEQDRQVLAKAQNARIEYLQTLDTLIQMIQAGNRNEAITYLATAVEEKQAPYFRVLEELIDF